MIPYLAVGLSVSIVNWIVEVKTTATYAKDPVLYFVLKGRTAWDYLAHLTGIPRLNPIYDTPPLSADVVSMLVALAGLLFLPALAWLGFRWKNRVLGLGAGWIFVMLLPAVFFPVPTYLADRYLYLASLGFSWLVAYALVEGTSRVRPRTLGTGIAVVVTMALAALFWIRTDRYNRVWANSETLWSYTLEASQDFRAYNNLARVRMEQKRWEEAERLFRLGSRQPNVTSWDGLTAVYYSTGRYAQALEANDEALRLHRRKGNDPVEEADLHYKRGTTLLALRRLDEGIAELTEAVRINPRHPDAARMLGLAQQAKREGG
jgi:tetratricopeptide (TPR) repeat protein